MARGINKVILIGYCGQDPETSYTAGGSAVTKLSLATSESWKDKTSGQPVEKTEWHKIVAFNRIAEIIGEYVRKGSKIYIEGSLRTNKWQDQQGQDRYTTEIVVSQMQMLDSRSENGSSAPAHSQPAPASQPQSNAVQGAAEPPPALDDNFDQDIPF